MFKCRLTEEKAVNWSSAELPPAAGSRQVLVTVRSHGDFMSC